MLAMLVAMRLGIGAGWGNLNPVADNDAIPIGFAHSVPDNLSYAAWVQQAKDGQVPFSNLFTAEPGNQTLVVPLFWLLGVLARLLHLHPIFVLNLSALLLASAAVGGLYLLCRRSGLRRRAACLAMFFLACGAGLSIPLIGLSAGAQWAGGADIKELGLFPATAFAYYPYQAIALAFVVLLLGCLLVFEPALRDGASPWGCAGLTALAAAFLVACRPYEPAVFLFLYALYTGLAIVLRLDARVVRARLLLFAAMAAPMLPMLAYDYWVSKQPAWVGFATMAFDVEYTRAFWLVGFGLFWPAAAYGFGVGVRSKTASVWFLGLWSAYLFVLLVVADRPEARLAGGGFVALAVLAAIAVDDLLQRVQRLDSRALYVAFPFAALLVLSTAASPFTFFLNKLQYPPAADTVDSEVIVAARQLKSRHATAAVASNMATGNMLPAVAGLRVFAGHWALTPDAEAKYRLLVDAGFEKESPPMSTDSETGRKALTEVLSAAGVGYVLVRRDRPAFGRLETDARVRPIYEGRRWVLFEIVRR